MNRKTCTIDDVISWSPCMEYTPEKIANLFGGRSSLSVLEILDLDIPADDRFWAVLRSHFFTKCELLLIGADFAEEVLHIFEEKYPNDNRPRNAIEVTRMFVKGEIADAARAAAWAAARGAARAAAWDAARAAAWAAAWDAARAAASGAMQKKQIEIVKKYVK